MDNEIRNNDRIRKATRYKNILLYEKCSTLMSIQRQNPNSIKDQKQKYLIGMKYLQLLSTNQGSKINNLSFIKQSLKIFHKNKELTEKFCSTFPYKDFFDMIVKSDDMNITYLSLTIFSYCTNSQHYPRNIFSNIQIVDFLMGLLRNVDKKHQKCIITIFKETMIKRPDVRNYLLQNGVLEFILPDSSHSVDFIVTCMVTEPRIGDNFLTTINLLLVLAIRSNKLKPILQVLQMFKLRSFANSNLVDQHLINYIFSDLVALNLKGTQIPIMNVANSIKLDPTHYIPIVMNYLGKSTEKNVTRKCLKILKANYEEWRVHQEICQFIFQLIPNSYEIERNLAQVLMCYIIIGPNSDLSVLEFISKFISDNIIGVHCLAFIHQVAMTTIQSANDEASHKIVEFLLLHLETIEEILASGNEYSQPIAQTIIDLLQSVNAI